MTGRVVDGKPTLPVTLRLPNRPDLSIDFVIDTGFDGHLTLPSVAVAVMQLPLVRRIPIRLADGSPAQANLYELTILWDGEEHIVTVLATGTTPLLGRALLDGNELVAQFAEGGLVTVETL